MGTRCGILERAAEALSQKKKKVREEERGGGNFAVRTEDMEFVGRSRGGKMRGLKAGRISIGREKKNTSSRGQSESRGQGPVR